MPASDMGHSSEYYDFTEDIVERWSDGGWGDLPFPDSRTWKATLSHKMWRVLRTEAAATPIGHHRKATPQPQPQPQPAPQTSDDHVRLVRNRYRTRCHACGALLPAYYGYAVLTEQHRYWRAFCANSHCLPRSSFNFLRGLRR